MLAEVFLCLAGYRSPLLQETLPKECSTVETNVESENSRLPGFSPPERALLSTAARLGGLHANIKKGAASVSANHGSTVCKAVASAIASTQLQKFMTQIVATERSILSKDSGYVGGYGIVPLSAVMADFAPWTRRLEWLWEVVCYMQPVDQAQQDLLPQKCTGSSIINFLRRGSRTGYVDLEAMALELVKTAELVWLQQLSSWILYGKQPAFGSEDFFIQPFRRARSTAESRLSGFSVHKPSLPEFVSLETASSALFIVQSLNEIRTHDQVLPMPTSSSTDPAMKLLPAHLECLKTVQSPISLSVLTKVIGSIRTSISHNALAQLLPLSQVLEALHVLQDFLLLRRGEFATSLIANADKLTRARREIDKPIKTDRKTGRFHTVTPRDSDIGAILSQTWSELAALNSEDRFDGTFDKGRELLRIIKKESQEERGNLWPDFSSFVFQIPASITFSLPPKSPLTLLLSQADLDSYTEINSYLLGIRRAAMHLESLWRLTSLRRFSRATHLDCNSDAGFQGLASLKRRQERRSRWIRPAWATASKAQFVLMELEAYFQGRIVDGYSRHFLLWVNCMTETEELSPLTAGLGNLSTLDHVKSEKATGPSCKRFQDGPSPSRDGGFQQIGTVRKPQHKDAATLAKAHREYLIALRYSLLLNSAHFTNALLALLRVLDHFVALFERLQTAQRNVDLQHDTFGDIGTGYKQEEVETLHRIKITSENIEEQLVRLVKELRKYLDGEDRDEARERAQQRVDAADCTVSSYVTWRAPTIDNLLMKLDFVEARSYDEALGDEDKGHDSH